jgi:putative serine protease PepD
MAAIARRPADPPAHRPPDVPAPRRLTLLVAAFLGGVIAVSLLALTSGLDGGSSSTTTVVQRVSGGSDAPAASLDAGAVFAAAAPGVVDISARVTTTAQVPGPFGDPQPSQTSTVTGSGFVLDASGRILTAAHVVEDAASVRVKLVTGASRTATVLGRDNATDAAVLKIDPSGLTLQPLKLGRSSALRTGAAVAAIGDPFEYERSISTGIVSGLDRTIQAPNGYTVAHAIQTDAALNPGNSGGPLLDGRGRVVGVVDQIATNGSAEQSSGVGFAVPIDLIAAEIPALARGRTVRHSYLGVSTSTTSTTAGALVQHVAPGGPALHAGLRAGDVVIAIDGVAVTGPGDLVSAIADHAPGVTVTLTVRRGASTRTLSVTFGTQPTLETLTTG